MDDHHEEHKYASYYPRIRIAVLDTGINISTLGGQLALLKRRRKLCERGASSPIKQQQNFTQEGEEDTCGHGTKVLQLLLRAAPDADFYVAKISEGIRDNNDDTANAVTDVSYVQSLCIPHNANSTRP